MAQDELTVAIRDGTQIVLRPIRPDDKQELKEGFERLSPESRYKRFLAPISELRPKDLRYLTEVDHHDHEAIVAHTVDGEPLGVARYVRTSDDTAEAAVAVVDDWQGRGVGTALVTRLAERACAEGIGHFTATCLASNNEVLDLLRDLGHTDVANAGDGIVEATIDLPTSAETESPLRHVFRWAAAGELEVRLAALRDRLSRARNPG
jgi:GNAT superfamily N-acetyltransferase